MLKIVLKRLRGRRGKRDLLSLVLFLSFLFMISALLFFHNQALNAQIGREKTYGHWEHALYHSDAKTVGEITALPEVTDAAVTRILGRDKRFGVVGSTSSGFESLGNFRLKEGRMPQALDEIAVEEKQLIHFGKDFKLGQETIVAVEVKEGEDDPEYLQMMIYLKIREQLIKDLMDHPEVQKQLSNSFREYFKDKTMMSYITFPDESIKDPFDSPKNLAFLLFFEQRARNENLLEGHHGTQMAALRQLFYINEDLAKMLPQEWRKKYAEFPYAQSVVMQRDMKVVGILENYSETWKGDNEYKPNAFVSEETAGYFLEKGLFLSKKIDMTKHMVPHNVFLKSKLTPVAFTQKYGAKYKGLNSNDYAFPPGEQAREGLIRRGTLLFLALVTTFSVFYVYQSKFQKQVRSLGLFRALGASKQQLHSYMLLDMLLRTLRSFLFAAPIAFLFSYLMIRKGGESVFEVPLGLLCLGIMVCLISIMIATLLPFRKLKHISLTGSIQLKDKKKQKTREVLKKAKPLRNFEDIERRHALYGRKKRGLRIVQLSALLLVLLLCLLTIFLSFEEYRRDILATGRPDYAFTIPQRGNPNLVKRTKEEFLASPVIQSIETLVSGERIFLNFKGNKGDPIYDKFLELLPQRYLVDHKGEKDSKVDKGYRLDIFSIEEKGEAYRKLKKVLPKDFDEKAFFEGSGAILLTPRFKKGNERPKENDLELFLDTTPGNRLRRVLEYYKAYDFQVDEGYKQLYDRTTTFDGLEKIGLYEIRGIIMGSETYLEKPQYNGKDVKVLAHLDSLPSEGIWPFSYDKDYPVVLFSRKGMHEFFGYPASVRWENRSLLEGIRMFGARGQGHTHFYLKTSDHSPETEMVLRALAHPYHMHLEKLGELADQLYQKGLSGALLSGLLGFVILLITSQILYQGFKSELEEESFRIGTLQSMGVQAQDLKKNYLKRAIEDVGIALVLSHLIYGILLILLSFRGQGIRLLHLESLLKLMLWKYPWIVHIILVLMFILVGIATSYFPLKRSLRRTPLENIRNQ